jgi:hypothetical protein
MRRQKPVRWSDICRSAEMLGIKDRSPEKSKSEAFRINKMLERMIADGKVIRVKAGLYRLAD